MDNVKKGILCQLFGGTNKTTSEERFRCDCAQCLLVASP